jgi:hypothetical protein
MILAESTCIRYLFKMRYCTLHALICAAYGTPTFLVIWTWNLIINYFSIFADGKYTSLIGTIHSCMWIFAQNRIEYSILFMHHFPVVICMVHFATNNFLNVSTVSPLNRYGTGRYHTVTEAFRTLANVNKAVLRIGDIYPVIPDPNFYHPGFRIRIFHIPDPHQRV